jgi:hypothetical protein
MMSDRKVIARYANEDRSKCVVCATGKAEKDFNYIPLWEVTIATTQICHGRNGKYTKPAYHKYFDNKDAANRYAMAIIKKERMCKV